MVIHGTLLRLPYFWDEGGYYIPAALDFYHRGSLIPEFTNAHPPLPNILLGLFWDVAGFHILGTRLLICAVAAAALLAVLRLAQRFLDAGPALTVCLLTGVYSIWYVQSTLAHADIFAACFTLWGLVAFFRPEPSFAAAALGLAPSKLRRASGKLHNALRHNFLALAALFTLAALAKETAIVEPVALAALELLRFYRSANGSPARRLHARRAVALCSPVPPLGLWFAYHRLRTGFTFGNPEFLRYNATANLSLLHIASALRYRFVHLFWQREIWIPLLIAVLCLLSRREGRWSSRLVFQRLALPRRALDAIAVLVAANWLAFSVLGGALLTRYLLPVYPLLLLLCVAVWSARTPLWPLFAAATGALFVSAWWINPPTYFAPEDNLAYRDMIVVHQEAIHFVRTHYPEATVLAAWPIAADLVRPELGYIDRPLRVTSIDRFTLPELRKAAEEPENFDTAIVFSTRFASSAFQRFLRNHPQSRRAREYRATRDLFPAEVASLLGGQVVWQDDRNGEWAAVLRFPRSYQASLQALPSP